MKNYLFLGIFLGIVFSGSAQTLSKLEFPNNNTNYTSVTTIQRLAGTGFLPGEKVYDINLEANFQYLGDHRWILLSGPTNGQVPEGTKFPVVNAVQTNLPIASPNQAGGIYTGQGDISASSNGVVSIDNFRIDNLKILGNTISSEKIRDGTIANVDISNNAAISGTKIAVGSLNIDRLDFSTLEGSGLITVRSGSISFANSNKFYNGLSRDRLGNSDSVLVGPTDVALNIFSKSSSASSSTLAELGLTRTNSGIYFNNTGGEILIAVNANVNFRRNANDTGERTLKLELLDCDPSGTGTNSNASTSCALVETHNIRTIRGTVVGDLPASIDGRFKLYGLGNGSSRATAFRILAKSGVATTNIYPIKIGGYQSADTISILRLQ